MFAEEHEVIIVSHGDMKDDKLQMSLCTCVASLLLIAEYAVVTRDAAP